jgi:hypothetical protein
MSTSSHLRNSTVLDVPGLQRCLLEIRGRRLDDVLRVLKDAEATHERVPVTVKLLANCKGPDSAQETMSVIDLMLYSAPGRFTVESLSSSGEIRLIEADSDDVCADSISGALQMVASLFRSRACSCSVAVLRTTIRMLNYSSSEDLLTGNAPIHTVYSTVYSTVSTSTNTACKQSTAQSTACKLDCSAEQYSCLYTSNILFSTAVQFAC